MSGKADKGENMNAGLSAENSAGKRDCFARSDSAARKLAEQESANWDFESRDFDGHDFVERVLIENGLELPVPVESNSTVKSETVKSETAEPEATESQTAEQAAQSGTESGSEAGAAARPDSVSGASGRAPRLRFAGFTEPWQTKKFSDFTYASSVRNKDNLDLVPYAITNEHGFIPQNEAHDEFGYMKNTDRSAYRIVSPDSFGYNPARINIGSIGFYDGCDDVIVSSLYEIFKTDESVDDRFLSYWFKTNDFQNWIARLQEGSVRLYFYYDKLRECKIPVPPSVGEQRQIGMFFSGLDRIISVQERKTELLRQAKKYFLQNMFPRRGESAPRLRVHGFTQPWQTRKFGDTVTIERGGSPRPIDKFITDDENGLNWIKIGDAPEFGNYITHTSEKIIPEGLSKTRQVHPGDLILSNSMSFGKPYIMGINGCIHDGWLLIRDEEENYDLKFLCVLLGTESMLNQYKAMAAGSTVNNLNKQLVGGTVVSYPSVGEQRQIGMFFSGLDRIIGVQRRKTEALRLSKKDFLQNMFA